MVGRAGYELLVLGVVIWEWVEEEEVGVGVKMTRVRTAKGSRPRGGVTVRDEEESTRAGCRCGDRRHVVAGAGRSRGRLSTGWKNADQTQGHGVA